MKVVMCQLMMNVPMQAPVSAMLTNEIRPRYSGARKRADAPKCEAKLPAKVATTMYQKMSSPCTFRKCNSSSCTGRKRNQ